VLEPVGYDAQSERLDTGDGEVLRLTVGKNAGKLHDLRNPTAVGLLLKLDAEMH
jgi:hypothetical protein